MKTDSETAHTGCIEEIEVKKEVINLLHRITKVERRMRMKRQNPKHNIFKRPKLDI